VRPLELTVSEAYRPDPDANLKGIHYEIGSVSRAAR